jgi:transcription antitermination factor NusG
MENTQPGDGARWFALTVRHQHERQTAEWLAANGWETMVPLYRARRNWSDRVKELELPLFAGYVLCRFALAEKIRVLNTPGVARVVGFGGAPVPLADREIDELRIAMSSKQPLRPWPYLKTGDKLRIERGPLRGLEGTLLQDDGAWRLVVGIELLQRAMAVEVAPDMIAPLRAVGARAA